MDRDNKRQGLAGKGYAMERGSPTFALTSLLPLTVRPQDLNRFASPIVKLAFEGPDVHEECLYEILRVSLTPILHCLVAYISCSRTERYKT